jgi:hypothetical protein
LIDFKRVRHAARPSKDLRTSSLFGSSNGPTKHRTIGPRNDLTGILVCRRSAGFTDTFGCHRYLRVSPAFITRPSPPGLARSANCAWRTPVLQTVHGYRHRASSEAHRASPGRSRVPPGTHRNLRVPPNASGRSPALHPSRTGLSRPIARPAAARTTSVVHRTTSVAHQVRLVATSVLGCSPEPPGSTRVPSETHRSQFVQTRRLTAIASFRYNGPLVRRPLAELCNVSGATVVTFESTPGFRLSYRR